MRFTIPAMIHNVQFERKKEISQDDGDAELKTLGTATQDIGGLQQQINVINEELNRQTHFRGNYLLNTDIQQLENSANGDFAFSAESGTVWMYDNSWYDSGDIVLDQVTPASDVNPLIDSGTGVAGTSTEYSHDHQHPLQVSTSLPSKDTSVGTIGSASSYARSDHQHPIQTVDTIPVSDSADGSYGTVDLYARNDHSHPVNVQTNASIILIVNGVENNGTSAFYSRHDHVHLQQLTYDGNVTATKFIKTGGLATEILCANGDTKAISDIDSDSVKKTCKSIQIVQRYLRYGGKPPQDDDEESDSSDDDDYQTRGKIYSQYVNKTQTETIVARKTFKNDQFQLQPIGTYPNAKILQRFILNAGTSTSFASITSGNMQINPTATSYDDGLRISRTDPDTGNSSIQLGCCRTSNTVTIVGQWTIFTPPNTAIQNSQSFVIASAYQAGDNTRGLQISADGNTLTFNDRVL
ncbi:MAG: hypothetical protein EZS28_001755 [Streblomastix strix]|uniref:Uncharacterized protein n=1 Tax=Streblomastix strix TaxID=222440 RepID=A0A5J4X6B4_9EUKA|nr:MAG: hypothetical protein EZS28_001755 [Streblomastix strix]